MHNLIPCHNRLFILLTLVTALSSVLMIAFATVASGEVVLEDNFNSYSDGWIVGQAGSPWDTYNIDQTKDANIVSQALENHFSRVDDVIAPLLNNPINKGKLYARFTVRVWEKPQADGGAFFAHFYVNTGRNRQPQGTVWINASNARDGQFRLGVANSTNQVDAEFRTDLNYNQTYTVIVVYDTERATTTLYVDPTDENDRNAVTASDGAAAFDVTHFGFHQIASGAALTIDDLRVATTWDEVANITLTFRADNPGDAFISAGQQDVPVCGFTLDSTVDLQINTLTLTATGSGHDANGIDRVRLMEDNGDGRYGPEDTEITSSRYATDNGDLRFEFQAAGILFDVPAGRQKRVFVVYYFNNSITQGQTFACRVTAATISQGSHAGLPITSSTLTVDAASLAFTANNPANGNVFPGENGRVIARFTATASGADVTLNQIDISASGTGDDITAITQLRLVRDANNDGAENAGDTTLGAGTFTIDNGTISLSLNNALVVRVGTPESVLLVYDFSAGYLVDGVTFGASLSNAQVVPNGAVVSGLPVSGRTVTLRVPRLTFAANNPANSTVNPGNTSRTLARFTLTATNMDVALNQIDSTATGTGHDAQGITQIRLVRDTNNDGLENAGDTTLASGAYAADNATRTLVLGSPLMVQVGTPVNLLLVADFSISYLSDNVTFAATLQNSITNPAAAIVSGLPLNSAQLTLRVPNLAFAEANPGDRTVQPGSRVVSGSFTLTATNGPVNLRSLQFVASGTGFDDTEITLAELILDTNGDGQIDGGDVTLGTGTFAIDNGTVTIDRTANPVLIPVGTPLRCLIVHTFAATVRYGMTFQITAQNPGVQGATTSGTPVASSVVTVAADGSFVTSGSSGCGCAGGTGSSNWAVFLLGWLALLLVRRRV